MLKRRKVSGNKEIKVSFVLEATDPRLPASVVGDFNGWQEGRDRFVKRNNGTWSAVVSLEPGRSYRFRYRGDDGRWFDDEAADGYEPNVHGGNDCLVVV